MEVRLLSLKTRRNAWVALATVGVLGLSLAGCAPTEESGPVEISFLVDDVENTVKLADALSAAFEAANPDITVNVETRPGGADGDNIVKTRLATGEMADVFIYNSGSLFQALSPADTLVPATDAALENVLPSFQSTVSVDGVAYGVPLGTAMGGGILYNKAIYAELGLEVPTTWDEFMANSDEIKAAGITAVLQSYKDTWTSQLLVLGDFANVLNEDPEWADKYTANEVKYATDDAARAGFEHLQEVFEGGYLNEDFGSATFDQTILKLANGEGAHYPMLTFAIQSVIANAPDKVEDVGVFALPGTDSDKVSLTTWMPAALYIPQSTEGAKLAAAQKFLEFAASVEACDIQTETVGVQGPYLIEGCTLPDDVPGAVADMLPYFETEGGTQPALEFLSPIKGPALEQITVAVGSGITSAADGAAQYDVDVEKQAQQLGLPGW